MEVRVLQPARSERIDIGRVDIGSETTELGEASVVEQHDHHIGSGVPRMRRIFEVGLAIGQRATNHALEVLRRQWCVHIRPRTKSYVPRGT